MSASSLAPILCSWHACGDGVRSLHLAQEPDHEGDDNVDDDDEVGGMLMQSVAVVVTSNEGNVRVAAAG